ncbi:MAG: hypothetical protein EU548_01625 [Promethearchaeota archaeon]|nr:MAG: hypothetical protein EU548_01625 [Candidatus Lokiarchaeota archaeon]
MVEWVDGFFKPLAAYAWLMMVLLGIMWLIYAAYEANRRETWRKLTKIDDWEFDITPFLKLLTYVGFILGILSIFSGATGLILNIAPSTKYATETLNSVNYFTSIFLIIFGLLTFFKPLNDLPIPSIIGLAAASLITAIIIWVIAALNVSISTTIAVALIVIFLIIFAITAISVKFYTALFMSISKIISWPPFAFIAAVFCVIQGLLLVLLGISIV